MSARGPRTARREVAAAAALTATAMLLAACGGGGEGGSDSAGEATCSNEIPKTDVEQVTVWAWYPAFEQVVDLFNETHDDVQICWTNAGQGADEYTKFSQAIEAGSGAPDVIMLEAEVLSSFTIRDGLVDLAEYGAAELEEEYTEGAWSDVKSGDAIYAIPVDGGPMGMLYRQDIFDEYGIEVPATWEEFEAAARGLQEAGFDGVIADFPPNGGALLHALFAQNGWQPFTYDSAAPTEIGIDIDTPEALEVLEYWNGLVQEGLVATDDAFTTDYNTKLVDGSYATYLAAAWGPGYLGGLSDADEDAVWRAAPMPQWDPANPVQVNWGGSTFAVTSQAANPELAAEVAMGIFGTEEAWEIGIEEAALFPLWRPILESDYFVDLEYPFFDGQQINREVFLPAAADYTGFTFAPFQPYVYDQQTQHVFAMVQGESDPASTLQAFHESITGYATSQAFEVQ